MSVDGDTVLVADGIYTGDGNRDLDFKGKAITVTSENGAENCIIDCEGSEQNQHRGFYFHSGETEASVVGGFTLRNGYSDDYGGGINCYRSSPTITNNIIEDNWAHAGGGIGCTQSSDTITNNTITGNSVNARGGGICCENNSFPSITNNVIEWNGANDGGGLSCSHSSPTITNNTITGNSVSARGGGICCENNSFPSITNNAVERNRAGEGGGLSCSHSSPTITNNTITRNDGGGIYCSDYSSPMVLNTILWEDSPHEIYVDDTSEITITYSDIQGGWEGEGNIEVEPLFFISIYLYAGSPCLSTANCDGAPLTDKDGRPRPLGSGCDMGCYEQCDEGLICGDVSRDCRITALDASLVLKYVIGLTDLPTLEIVAADVTDNGNITALDAALILQYTVGLITQFPVQQGAPILTIKDENQKLTQIIAEFENVFLTTEQKHVLEQLKQLIGQQPLPSHTVLLQNYPNPFNPETWLPYKLAQDASVTIRIYNVKGQLVRTLHLGNQNAGVYMTKAKAAHWDGKDSLGQSVASGVYFYTLQVEHPNGDGAGIFTATHKMVILK